MKEAIKKEDAERYEIMHRLQAKRNALYPHVSNLMRRKQEIHDVIVRCENELHTINGLFRTPGFADTEDGAIMMARRITLRFRLETVRYDLKSIKHMLVEQNRKFSKTEMDITRYKEQWYKEQLEAEMDDIFDDWYDWFD